MKEEISQLLEVLDGLERSNNDECLAKSRQVETILESVIGTELEDVCCNLFHYLNDEDIRSKDCDYKAFQNSELEKLKLLLENNDLPNAKSISFLQATSDL